jgi:hypothetical protein
MSRLLCAVAVAGALVSGPVGAADSGSRIVGEWLRQCESPRPGDRTVCLAILGDILTNERRALNAGSHTGYICPPPDFAALPVLRLVNQQIRARAVRYAGAIDSGPPQPGAGLIHLAVDALTDLFPCPGME